VQDSVEVCGVGGSVTLAGLGVQVNPAGLAVAAKLTEPENPPRPVTVIVEVPVLPATIVKLVGLALRAKSVTVTLTEVVLDWTLLAPVTVTV